MTRQYAAFDEVTIGTGLVLTQGDQILATSSTVDIHRHARSTFSLDQFQGSVEARLFGTGTLASGKMRIGLVTGAASTAMSVGEDVNGWGWDPYDGKIYSNNAVVATIGTAAFGDTVSLSIDPLTGAMTIAKNNAVIGAYVIGAGAFYIAATVSGAPGAFQTYVNFGQQRFEGSNAYGGWWISPARIAPEYMATEGFTTSPLDAIPHLQFQRAISLDNNNYTIARALKFWFWGNSAPSQLNQGAASASITINDPYLNYSNLLINDVRDLPAALKRTQKGARYDAAEHLFTGVIDRVDPASDYVKTVTLKGFSATLQRALQTRLFPPDAQTNVANKPRPISIGACRNYEPDGYDLVNKKYAMADAPLSALGVVRVAGKALTYPTDFALTPDVAGIVLTATPVGKFTVESTDIGPSFSSGGVDFLGGAGVFVDANLDGIPDGWTPKWRKYPSTPELAPGFRLGEGLFFPQEYEHIVSIGLDTITIPAGRSFAYKFTISAVGPREINGGGPLNNGWPLICLCGANEVSLSPPGAFYRSYQFAFARIVIDRTGVFTGSFTNTTGIDQTFAISCFLPATVWAPGTTPYEGIGMSSIYLNELPDVGTNTPLLGASLERMLTELLEVRGGLTAAQWSHADAAAIDVATGYQIGIHYGVSDTPTIADAVKGAIDNFATAMYEDGNGVLRFFRWIAPETVVSGSRKGAVMPSHMLSDVILAQDFAENLATRMKGSKNYSPYTDGDFGATTLTDCPIETRAQLKADYQWSAVCGRYFSPRYAAAAQRAQTTWFDRVADGTSEINLIGAGFAVPRNFYIVTLKTPAGHDYALGDVRDVTYLVADPAHPGEGIAQYGLDAKPCLLLCIGENPTNESSVMIFWG